MKAKHIHLTEREQIIIKTLVAMDIQSSKASEEMGIEPAFGTKELKALYVKMAGYERER